MQFDDVQIPSIDDQRPPAAYGGDQKTAKDAEEEDYESLLLPVTAGAGGNNNDQVAQKDLPETGSQTTEEEEEVVMAAGAIMRAPLPIKQVLEMEAGSGNQQGTYFVELMRRRLQGLLAVQDRWISRLCNQKHAKHVDTQIRIRDFMLTVIAAYEEQFGAPNRNPMASVAPVRHRRRASAVSTAGATTTVAADAPRPLRLQSMSKK